MIRWLLCRDTSQENHSTAIAFKYMDKTWLKVSLTLPLFFFLFFFEQQQERSLTLPLKQSLISTLINLNSYI